ncbi:wings apart-like protein regulation of heterochromatin-domain-containing protein [Chaetomium strumarium]|uniref:Wings apart-like protein regulation of heterochromatin-domain-containing protein n=1 Tax=Chaetomium strumarium TaxID=1170767 RepID=A0AAJ0M4D9_9PEZI|nr:wings apart-like protein regulation of heterochromatin-domain-containing protein [Chaetomium strumarium]
MLADDDPLLEGAGFGGLGGGSTGGALFNFGRLTKSSTINTFSYLDEDEETANTGAVRSIHELRQAGANSRFADEMDDILDRVGSPSDETSSLRRGALLEVAQKMKHKDFRLQFRNHSGGESLFKSLGNETDLVSGYAILAIVTTLLASTTSGLLIQRLRSQGLATLVGKLLEHTADIAQLGKDRKQNVSRNGQLTLAAIKSSILGLPVWEPFSPTSLSPRTLALKCLDLLMRQPVHASAEDELLSKAVTDRLFSILADGVSNSACWDLSNQQESCDLYFALYVLEGHSASAMQSPLRSAWTKQYAPIAADVLETALKQPTEQLGDLASLILRISLNITNHNGEASQLFVNKGLLKRLAISACGAFGMVVCSMKVDSFMSKVLESLIMMLGAMINFCVYYPPASNSLEERGDGAGSPLNELIRIFADNHSKTAEADSMEKTQLNVALGYLSILLGYLCLSDSIRDRFVSVHPKRNIQPLIDSLNEFIAFHRKVAEAQPAESSGSGSLTRLQNLADQLSALR